MAVLGPILQKPTFLHGWEVNVRYESDMSEIDAERLFNAWQADVESLFQVAQGLREVVHG